MEISNRLTFRQTPFGVQIRIISEFFFLSFQDHASVLKQGSCQIPDPLYKLIGSIICFYVPLIVMMITYALTVRLLASQQQSLGMGPGWTGMWLSSAAGQAMGK